MPGEVIDEFSIKINADVDEMIETTQDAMQQIEDMFDEMVTKGLQIKVPEAKTIPAMVKALDKINEAMGNTIETSQLVEKSIRKLQDAGLSTAQAYIVLADAVSGVTQQTEALKELADAEAFELQSEMLGKVNEGLTIMESAWVAAGQAIPIEKLDALESKLIKIFRTGVFDQKLSLEETFARMDEAIVESLIPLEKLSGKFSTLTTEQKILNAAFTEWEQGMAQSAIAENLKIIEQAFLAAGKAVDPVAMERYEKSQQAVILAAAKMGLAMPQALQRTDEMTLKATDSLSKYIKEAEKGKGVMAQLVSKVGSAFGIDTQQMMGRVNQIMETGKGIAKGFGIEIGAISTSAMVAVGVLALLALAFVAALKFAKEGIQIALQNADAHERFSLVIRQQQRALGNLALSQREANDAAMELKDNYGLARVEAEKLLASTMFLTREFKLSGQETLKLADAAAILGKQAGVGAESALRSLTQFMLTGYTQGLQQLGIQIKDGELEMRAYEKGLIGLTDELDETTKAMIAMEIILEKVEEGQQDVIDSTDSWANRIMIARGEAQDAKEDFGEMFLGVAATYEEIKVRVLEAFLNTLKIIVAWTILAAEGVGALVDTLKEYADQGIDQDKVPSGLNVPGMDIVAGIGAKVGGNIAEGLGLKEATENEETFTEMLARNREERFKSAEELINKMLGIGQDTEELNKNIGESYEELELRIFNASKEIQKEVDKLAEKFAEGMSRIQQRLSDTMNKITKDFGRRRKDAALDLTRDMRDIDASAQENTADAAMKHNEDLFRIEEDHKLKMARLEDQFLFDIEDAVRERDARGVLMAIRRFNQQKKEILQDKNIRTKRLKEDFKNELQEIEIERKRRRTERMLEFAEQSDDLAVQEARRREDALAAFANSERDLVAANKRKERILAEGFLAQFTGTNIAMNALFELMSAYIGPGGFMEGLYDSIAKYAAETNLNPNLSGFLQSSLITDDPNPNAIGHARGGTTFATSPTLMMFGEGGPERVDFTPLSQSTGLPRAGFGGGGGGGGGQTDINVDVGLEDGLVGEVVDQAMDGVANVVATVTKKTKQGAR